MTISVNSCWLPGRISQRESRKPDHLAPSDIDRHRVSPSRTRLRDSFLTPKTKETLACKTTTNIKFFFLRVRMTSNVGARTVVQYSRVQHCRWTTPAPLAVDRRRRGVGQPQHTANNSLKGENRSWRRRLLGSAAVCCGINKN